jgi:hypothetical protein
MIFELFVMFIDRKRGTRYVTRNRAAVPEKVGRMKH